VLFDFTNYTADIPEGCHKTYRASQAVTPARTESNLRRRQASSALAENLPTCLRYAQSFETVQVPDAQQVAPCQPVPPHWP
jgi:hypothetical protein